MFSLKTFMPLKTYLQLPRQTLMGMQYGVGYTSSALFALIINFLAVFLATDKPGVYRVVTPVTHPLSKSLSAGEVYRINTGAPLPAGADSIIMVEDTRLVSTKDPVYVSCPSPFDSN
jgi:hypothetical protein